MSAPRRRRDQRAKLYDCLAFVSGDSSQLFELPGGPVGFVLGGEYRTEDAFAAYDDTRARLRRRATPS